MDLLPQTKSNQTATADVVIAYVTASGKSLGLWLERLWDLCPAAARLPSGGGVEFETGGMDLVLWKRESEYLWNTG